MNVTRSSLLAEIRQYGHLEHLTHVSDGEIESRLDRAYRRCRAMLDRARGHEVEKKEAWLTLATNGRYLVLPRDFYQLRGLLVQRARITLGTAAPASGAEGDGSQLPAVEVGGGAGPGDLWEPTGEPEEVLEFGERDRVELMRLSSPGLADYRYRLRAVEFELTGPVDKIEILPRAREPLFFTALYLPQLDLTPVEGEVYYAGVKGIAEEWLILDVLISLKAKTDEQTGAWNARKNEIQGELERAATDRDAAQPARIRQVWHRTDIGRPMDRFGRRLPWHRSR
jgi:hypothetical protein